MQPTALCAQQFFSTSTAQPTPLLGAAAAAKTAVKARPACSVSLETPYILEHPTSAASNSSNVGVIFHKVLTIVELVY